VPVTAIVAMPGGGKSTVGRQLAKRLGKRFVDTDTLVEARIGCSIRDFFGREGEEAFRALETEALESATSSGSAVVATGGGAVLRPQNRRTLRERCCVIYLRATPEELFRRLRNDTTRPLLQDRDPLARLRELFAQREPLYREVADFVIETGRPSVATLVNMIQMQLELGAPIPAQDVVDRSA